ncbi:tRNA (34-2'-O)-methyltransferase regulator WDR6 isoform X2 [Rhynchophorus ferrugineus]
MLKRLKQHKGVIFHLDFCPNLGYICSASDDRSAILWEIDNKELLQSLSPHNKDSLNVNVKCQVYGHSSRVFQCCISKAYFITAGEDSLVLFWGYNGVLLKKFDTHQGGTVWSIVYDEKNSSIFTGGNDGGISKFKMNSKCFSSLIALNDLDNPKHVKVLSNENIVIFSEKCKLYRYNKKINEITEISIHNDLKSYSILEISPCHKMIALAGYHGQIYIYKEHKKNIKEFCKYDMTKPSRIFSLHWLNCKSFLVCQEEGKIFLCILKENKISSFEMFILPNTKERWSTCACYTNNHVIIGDRKGNIHNYYFGHKNPINSLNKAHSHLGVTQLSIHNGKIVSLGKDGILKKYKIVNSNLECIETTKTKFTWLAKLSNNCLYSFSGNNFMVSDCIYQRILFETPCGGGHRSWSFHHTEDNFIFTFIKQKKLHFIKTNLNEYIPKDIVQGYHVKEINVIKVLCTNEHILLISGGEDTILRVAALANDNINLLQSLKVHLSSIRVIAYYKLPSIDNEFIIISAGGRAQIICWHLIVENDASRNISVTCMEKCNFYEPLSENEAENRIMDLSLSDINRKKILIAGCSDGNIKLFTITDNIKLTYMKTIFYEHTCITKIFNIFWVNCDILVTMGTNGFVTYWNTTALINNKAAKPLAKYKTHQSGISATSNIILGHKQLLLITGGDDNAVSLSLLQLNKREGSIEIERIFYSVNSSFHCAQITGIYIGKHSLITCSIDQKIILYRWKRSNNIIEMEKIDQYVSVIADQQGFDCIKIKDILNLFIYGNGIEHLGVI